MTLPDGSVKELDDGATGADPAASIGPGLTRAALAIRVVDRDRPDRKDGPLWYEDGFPVEGRRTTTSAGRPGCGARRAKSRPRHPREDWISALTF